MRQHISVFMLYIRSSLYKVLGLLFAMAVVEGALFWRTLGKSDNLSLESMLESSYIIYAFIAFSLLMTVALCMTGCERGGKQGYTLHRLSIPESAVVLWQSLCNTCCYFLLWVVQIVVSLGLCRLYVSQMEAVTSNQTIFLAFYQSDFLHNLLPLDEISLWVRNILLLFSFGVASACFSYRQRRGKFAAEIIALFWASLVWGSRELGSYVLDGFAILGCVMVIGVELYRILTKEVPDEA